jgi:hypothetical protein
VTKLYTQAEYDQNYARGWAAGVLHSQQTGLVTYFDLSIIRQKEAEIDLAWEYGKAVHEINNALWRLGGVLGEIVAAGIYPQTLARKKGFFRAEGVPFVVKFRSYAKKR